MSTEQGHFKSKATVESLRESLPGTPHIIPASDHNVSLRDVDDDCLKVVRRLLQAGHQAFLVGGGVRDLALGKKPKDFDVSTSARPEEIRRLFRNSRVIGKRFKLLHVYFQGNKIIEVSTFRASTVTQPDEGQFSDVTDWPAVDEDAIETLAADNTFGDAQSDALRRDLTINGLFFEIETGSIVDYIGGMNDLRKGIIRIIGDPRIRIKEDPVRMVRALRHAARAAFTIEDNTFSAISELRELITVCPRVRIFEELCKDLRGGSARDVVELFFEAGLLPYLLPMIAQGLELDREKAWGEVEHTLVNIDRMIAQGREVSSAVIFFGIMLGSVPREFFEERNLLPVYEYWAASPIPKNVLNDPEAVAVWRPSQWVTDVDPSVIRELLIESVEQVYRNIGVYRKDREQIEKILRMRMELLLGYARQDSRSVDLRRNAMGETLQLLEVTAHDDLTKGALSFWQEKYQAAGGKKNEAKADKPKRNSRRRPRKKKPML